ncbi:MAG: hypothetical protein JNL11_06925 [Bdellovibrionaceae bacterium]|nr:hypothetical protein [Pseudobdellovibrionaceae bacterium]
MRFIYFYLFLLLLAGVSFGASCYSVNFSGLKEVKPTLLTIVNNTDDPPPISIPDIWDWRNVNGVHWLTPVTKQSGCNDCVMHAMASVFEGQLKISSGLSWITPRISIAEGFHCGGGICSQGWTGEQAVEKAKTSGFVDSACGEKIDSNNVCSSNLCSDVNSRRWKAKDYKTITQGTVDVNKIRVALLHGPVLTSMALYSDFGCYRWGVYRHQTNTAPVAGHMIAIVGYHKAKRAWIVKNSWGNEWVDQGYGYIYEKDTSGIGSYSWSLYLPPIEGFVDIENVQDNSLLKNEVSAILQSSTSNPEVLFLLLTKDSQPIFEDQCLGPRCNISIKTLDFADGDYEIHSYTKNSTTQQKEKQSLVKRIQILNGEPSLKSLRAIPSLLTKTENGFNISLEYSIRPYQLEFRILDAKNKLVYKQNTYDVSEKLSLYINPILLKQKNMSLETWISYGAYPLRLLAKTSL